jgi:hypothetical protein
MLTQRHKTLDELADTVAGALPDLDPAGQRLAIALYRLLAAGRPVAFASRRAGEQWAARHPGTFLLTLGEAAGLAARVNQRMFPDVLGTG